MNLRKMTAAALGIAVLAASVLGCASSVTEETTETTEATETTESTESTAAETTGENTTAETFSSGDEVIDQFMRIQTDPSPYEPDDPQDIDDLTDEDIKKLAQTYLDNGYTFCATAEDMWYNGAGYCWFFNGDPNPYFLIRGFIVQKEEDDSIITVACYMANKKLCEEYLDLVQLSQNGDVIIYTDSESGEDYDKITLDTATGILTFEYTIEHVSQGVG